MNILLFLISLGLGGLGGFFLLGAMAGKADDAVRFFAFGIPLLMASVMCFVGAAILDYLIPLLNELKALRQDISKLRPVQNDVPPEIDAAKAERVRFNKFLDQL